MTNLAAAPVAVPVLESEPQSNPDEPSPEQVSPEKVSTDQVSSEPSPVEPTVEKSEMPLPSDPKTVFLGGLFVLAFLAACYAAQAVVVPVVMAFFLKLLLQPLLRLLVRIHLPRPIAALMSMLILGVVLTGLGVALSMPAASWGKTVSEGFPRLEQKLQPLQGPIRDLQAFFTKAQQATGTAKNSAPVAVERVGVIDLVFNGTRAALEALVTTGVMLFFLMLSGETFLRRAVEVLPNFRDKRQAVEIAQQVEQDMSAYLLTVIAMNAMVGIVVGTAMWLCGMGDPVLWGAAAFMLNFVPILGPLTGVGIFLLAGFLRFDDIGPAMLPGAIYLGVHIIEGELVTPALLARRFTLNPVAVMLSLLFWYWMWGVLGAVLAVPMLAISKIICDRIVPLKAFGHFLEGDQDSSPRFGAFYAKNRSNIRS
jgi:predicted PurR-regulated permease PerM